MGDLRSEEVQGLTDRFLNDANEVVDAFVDLLEIAPDVLNRLASLVDSADGKESTSESP